MKQKLLQKLGDEYNSFDGDTIGEDISLNELVGTIMLAYTEVKMPELETELERFQGKKFSTVGKIDLLEEIRGEASQG